MTFLPFDLARRPGWSFVAAWVASTMLITFCGASIAMAAETDEVSIVAVHVPKEMPRSPQEARQLLDKLGHAALEACGASRFSLQEVQRAVMATDCYKRALASAVNQVNSPMLAELYARTQRNRAG